MRVQKKCDTIGIVFIWHKNQLSGLRCEISKAWGTSCQGVGLVKFYLHVNRPGCFLITAVVLGVVPVEQPKGTEESGGNDGLGKLLEG